MTVSSTTTKVSYAGNGSTTAFAYIFKIFAAAEITVIIRDATRTETVKTLTTDYTLSNIGVDGGGNVTFGSAPASGETVVLIRNTPNTQTLDLVENDPFLSSSFEDTLDKITHQLIEQQEEIDRSIKVSRTNSITSSEFTTNASDRASKVLGFDSSGELSVTTELGTFKGNWAASTAYRERDLVKDTSDGSIYIVNTAHTSSGSTPLDTNTNSSKYSVIFNVDDMVAGNVTASGNFTINGNTTLGNATSDTITATGRFDSSLIPSSSCSNFLGSTSLRWGAAYLNRVEALDSSMTSVFEGSINVKGNVDLGSNGLDNVSVLGSVDSDILPSADNTYDLGGTYKWADV